MHCVPKRLPAVALFFFTFLIASGHGAAQSSNLSSPGGRYRLRILEHALPRADPYFGDYTLILSNRKRLLSKVSTTGYLIDALWSPDGRYVAVNNRRGNSGDYVWVFSLTDGKSVKKPDDTSFSFPHREIGKICSDCNEGRFDRDLTIAKAWKSADELEVETRWRFYKTALIVRHAIYKISDRKVTLIQERVSRHPVDWQPPDTAFN